MTSRTQIAPQSQTAPAAGALAPVATLERGYTLGPARSARETEADSVATQLTGVDVTTATPVVPRISQEVGADLAQGTPVPDSVAKVLARGGQPLEPGIRADMERRFAHDFSRVRIHADESSAQSARDISAKAYTAGEHIVFGTQQFAPETTDGSTLLGHELAHVVQQGAARGAQLIQRQPADTSTAGANPPPRPIAGILADLRFARVSQPAKVPELITELLAAADATGHDFDLLNEGLLEFEKLSAAGDVASADRLLAAIRKKFFTAFMENRALPTPAFVALGAIHGDPRSILDAAKTAARAGDHQRAGKLFGTAHEMLTLYAHAATRKGQAMAAHESVVDRHDRYSHLKGIYGEMREIYAFYPSLEVESLGANDLPRANEARQHGADLLRKLQQSHTHIPDLPVATAELTRVKTGGGALAFRFEGANFEQTDLSELPGHSFPAELRASKEAVELSPLKDVQTALINQAAFQAEISYEAEVRKAFGNKEIDVLVDAQRMKLWRLMYGAYKKRGAGALGSLMALVGRFHKAYSYHTGFNVRDFGTSYLDTPMPSDVAGRLVHDCGVYALSVAWDIFRTVRSDSSLKLRFTLATMFDHMMLVIKDVATEEYYIVNNDQITRYSRPPGYETQFPRPKGLSPTVNLFLEDPVMPPPTAPDLDEEVARNYTQVRNVDYLVAPVLFMDIGESGDASSKFKTNAWKQYQEAANHMAKIKVTLPDLEGFSSDSAQLDLKLNELAGLANDAAAMAAFLQQGWPRIKQMLVNFERLGPKALKEVEKTSPRPKGARAGGAFRWTGSNHPVVRVALALLRVRALGAKLTTEQQMYLNYFELAFKELMDTNRTAAEAGQF
jgi:hypothetical protein